MPDFSGASLKLKAEGEEKLVATLDRIDKKAQQTVGGFGRLTQQEVDKASAAFDQLYGKQSKAARQTQQVVEDVSNKVDAAMNRTGRGVLAASRAVEVIGRTGKEAGRSLDTLLTQVSYLAFGFGSTGAIIAAVGITTAAIIEMFSRVSREHEKARESMLKTLEEIGHSHSLMRADEEATRLKSGDPFALRTAGETDNAFLARSRGIDGLTARIRTLNAEIAKTPKMVVAAYGNVGTGSAGTNAVSPEAQQRLDEIKAINDQLKLLGEGYARALQMRAQFMTVTAAAAKINLDKSNDRFAERSVAEYQNEELNRIVQRIKASGDLIPMLTNERNEVVALRNEQSLLRYELDRVNMSVKDRIEKEKELARVTKELQQTEGTNIFMNGMNVKVNPKVSEKYKQDEYDKEQIDAIKKSGEKMKQEAERIANGIGRTLAHGITDGIKTWFSGGGFAGGFKAMTASILDGLGQMFAQVAEKALIGSTIMQKVVAAIEGMNPWVAAVAAGALLAFGNSLRSSGGSGRGSGGGYSGSGSGSLPSIVNMGTVTAASPSTTVANPANIQSRAMQTNNYYVIGEDPKAWRQVQERLDQNTRRG